MRFKVSLLRQRGRRLKWIEVVNGPTFVGEITTHKIKHGQEDYHVAHLQTEPGSSNPPAVPELYEPVLLGFAPLAFRLRGYERIEDPYGAYSVVQEWHCELP
jgi:hypothetical protein